MVGFDAWRRWNGSNCSAVYLVLVALLFSLHFHFVLLLAPFFLKLLDVVGWWRFSKWRRRTDSYSLSVHSRHCWNQVPSFSPAYTIIFLLALPIYWKRTQCLAMNLSQCLSRYWTELKGDSPFILVKCAFSRIFVKNRIVLSTNEAWKNYRSAWQNRSDFLSFVEERTVSIFPSLIIHCCFRSC